VQIYVSIGRLTFRLALGLDEKDPTPSSDTPSPRDSDHPLADETPPGRRLPAQCRAGRGGLVAWTRDSSSDRKDRLPSDWSTRRVRVLRRDSYRCQARDSLGVPCGELANQVDHVDPGDDHSLDNLQALCRWHHARKSSAEGAAARRPQAGRARAPEQRPGVRPPPSL